MVPATLFDRLHTDRGSVSYPDILDWKGQTDLFEAVGAFNGASWDVTGTEDPERLKVFPSAKVISRLWCDTPHWQNLHATGVFDASAVVVNTIGSNRITLASN